MCMFLFSVSSDHQAFLPLLFDRLNGHELTGLQSWKCSSCTWLSVGLAELFLPQPLWQGSHQQSWYICQGWPPPHRSQWSSRNLLPWTAETLWWRWPLKREMLDEYDVTLDNWCIKIHLGDCWVIFLGPGLVAEFLSIVLTLDLIGDLNAGDVGHGIITNFGTLGISSQVSGEVEFSYIYRKYKMLLYYNIATILHLPNNSQDNKYIHFVLRETSTKCSDELMIFPSGYTSFMASGKYA